MQKIRSTAYLFLISIFLLTACSSPSKREQNTPPDPAADSVADGLIMMSDTTVVDDDTLETKGNTRLPKP